ncbi:hypothetical protein DCOP10_1171 [Armatimonadetes bacterium DC]|nr:hypothetical protein DCOP10_1171 [Armatimonadetes bacterium DC]
MLLSYTIQQIHIILTHTGKQGVSKRTMEGRYAEIYTALRE